MNRTKYIWMILLMLSAFQVAGQSYIIDKVCLGAERFYRINGEQGSTYTWLLYDKLGLQVKLNNPAGKAFVEKEPDGNINYGNEITIQWTKVGTYTLAAVQYSVFGCDTLEQGLVEVYDQPTVLAGNPLSICSDSKVDLSNAIADNAGTLEWTTSGDGTFDNPNALHTAYNIGPNDLKAGSVKLTLTAYGLGYSPTCIPSSSTLTATLKIAPNLIITNPPAVCPPETVDISASSIIAGSDLNLTYEYFADSMAIRKLLASEYKAISNAGTYYIRGTSPVTGCSIIKPVKVSHAKLIVPNFASIPELCLNSTPPSLPSASFNGISGHWNPGTISTNTLGFAKYIFTPDAGQCAKDTALIVKVSSSIVPTFTPITVCKGDIAALPPTSINGVSGTWNPSVISTTVVGSFPYVFTPGPGGCGETATLVVTITPAIPATFSFNTNLCQNSVPPVLPSRSNEGFTGTWSPAFVSTNQPGSTSYIFTPDAGQKCADKATVNIYINSGTVPQFASVGPLCFGDNFTLPNTSVNGITGKWQPSPVVDTSKSGIFSYTFTPDYTWCATSYAMNIEVYSKIVVLANAAPLTTYGGTTTVTVTAMGGSGNYVAGIGVFQLGAGLHQLKVIDDHGCEGDGTAYIANPQDLNVTASVRAIKCIGGQAEVTVTVTGGTAPYKYSYTGGDPSHDHVQLKENVFLVKPSLNPYVFEVFDANGLYGSISEPIFISNPPTISLTGSFTSPTCRGGSDGTATVVATNAAGIPTYSWNDPLNQTTAKATGLKAGTYTVTVTDDCGPVLFAVIIPESPLMSITAFGVDSHCVGANGQIRFGFTAVPDGQYDIQYDGGIFSKVRVTGGTASVTAAPGTYTNLQLLANGCSTPGVNAIVKPATPMRVDVVSKQPDCEIAGGVIAVLYPTVGTGYEYSVDNGSTYQTSAVFAGLTLGTYQVKVKELATGCESDARSIIINQAPVIPTIPVAVVTQYPSCNNPDGTLEITSPLDSGLLYSVDGINYQSSSVFTDMKTGTYTIFVKNVLSECTSSISIDIPAVPPSPVLSITGAVNPFCAGDLGQFNFSITNVVDGTYTLKYDGGKIDNVRVVGGKGSANVPAGEYNNLTIEFLGCTSDLGINVVVVDPDAIIIVIDSVTEVDLKSQNKGAIDLHATGGVPFSVGASYKYQWNTGATTEDIKDLVAGTYTITVTDSKGCSSKKTIIIPEPNNPPVAVDDQYSATCNVITGKVTTNDSDPENDLLFIDTKTVVAPVHGTVSLSVDGTFTYTSDPGFVGIDQFVYALFDKNKFPGITATVTISITLDTDGDGIANDLDPDADGDGILNVNEVLAGQDWKTTDSDGDGYPNALDIDSDGDGIVDNIESQSSKDYIKLSLVDSNPNGIDDVYDTAAGGTLIVPIDSDADGIPDFLDTDSDNDLVPDYIEGHDLNADGRPDRIFVGKDADHDGLDDSFDIFVNVCEPSENVIGSNAPKQDFDGDGMNDWRDENDDNDEYLTRFEDLNMDRDFSNDDTDFDGHPEYLDYGRDCDLFVPDAFSPNDDNIHDYFQVYCIDHFPNAQMFIFDQLGNKLFEKNNYGNLQVWGSPDRAWWDGRTTNRAASTNGGKVVPGTYYYVLRLGNGDVRKSFVFVSY